LRRRSSAEVELEGVDSGVVAVVDPDVGGFLVAGDRAGLGLWPELLMCLGVGTSSFQELCNDQRKHSVRYKLPLSSMLKAIPFFCSISKQDLRMNC